MCHHTNRKEEYKSNIKAATADDNSFLVDVMKCFVRGVFSKSKLNSNLEEVECHTVADLLW